MAEVLAVQRPGAPAVVAPVADALADLLGVEVSTTSEEGEAVLRHLERQDTVLGVVARDDPLSWRIATAAAKPVVLVPPPGTPTPSKISRVLAPLDGTLESAGAVAEALKLFPHSELVVLHVFDRDTVPPFWDQAAHARRDWEHEFRARFCTPPDARVELRNGAPEEHVAQVAAEEHAHLIALGWSQGLGDGRARTVRGTVHDATVPVILVPLRHD